MRIAKLVVILILCRPALATAQEADVGDLIATCPSLEECLSLLDTAIPAHDAEVYRYELGDLVASNLQRFGAAAKEALIARARGEDIAWRYLADNTLSYWPGWTQADIPLLIELLNVTPHGNMPRALAAIGTPEAIDALVANILSDHDDLGLTVEALEQLGAQAVPHLRIIPHGQNASRHMAWILSGVGGDESEPIIRFWMNIVYDTAQPVADRVAILETISTIGILRVGTQALLGNVAQLMADPDPAINAAALKLLRKIDDPIFTSPAILPRLAAACRPSENAYTVDTEGEQCLSEIAFFGEAAQPFAGMIAVSFLDSANGSDRADAASVLAFINYRPAIPRLVSMLEDPVDWRVVYAAIRGLGWLGATEAIPALEAVAGSHWLPDVRAFAAETAHALRETGSVPRPAELLGDVYDFLPARDVPIRIGMEVIGTAPYCEGRKHWQGIPILFPELPSEIRLRVPDGELVARDAGEFVGDLSWVPAGGESQILLKENIRGILPASDGAVAVVDLQGFIATGDAFIAHLTRADGGAWYWREIGRLPTGGFGILALGADLFAAWGFANNLRVTVFTPDGILGLAECLPQE